MNKILADAFNGFSFNDLPFLVIQLCVSALMAWFLRIYWLRATLSTEEAWLVKFIMSIQVVFTLLAVFAQRSPWTAVVFGMFLLAIVTAGQQLSLRSRIFFMLCTAAAWGLGSGNFVVTLLVYLVIVCPLVHLSSAPKK